MRWTTVLLLLRAPPAFLCSRLPSFRLHTEEVCTLTGPPSLQPLTALPLASHSLPTLALNSHSRPQYTEKLFPPKRTHYLQGRKRNDEPVEKISPKNRGSRTRRVRAHTPPPSFVPVDLMLPKRFQGIKYLCPGPHPGQTFLLPYYPTAFPFLLPPAQHVKSVLLYHTKQDNCIWGKSYIWFQDIQRNIQQCLQRLSIPISL